jgi:hypothetical protein
MALGELIEIEEEFFGTEIVNGFAEVLWVLLAFERFGEIKIAAAPIGNGKIRLLDAPQHLLIELLLECFGRPQNGIGIGVFGFQVGNDFRVLFVAEPGVMVDAAVAMQNVLDRLASGDRGPENCTL